MSMAEQQLFVETDLIRQAQNGNSAAFGELYGRHLAAIQHYIQKRVSERCDAEDLTQTVFVKAWHALRDYQPSGAPFRAWLYRIAHNAIVDHYRAQRHPLFWDDLTWLVDPQDTPEASVLNRERQETVRNAVAGLRQNYQAVIDHRFLQELDYGETAAELGQQINHVRVVQHRALDVLRRVLSQDNALWLAAVVTVLSLLLGGKVVVAAEQALPGDRLYPMRTWVEETRLFLADDANAVQLHTQFATQRIEALNTLYQQGRRADMETAIAATVTHIRSASAQLATVHATERTAVTSQFVAALQNQIDTLQQLTLANPQTKTTLVPVLVALSAAQATLPDAAAPPLIPTPTAPPQATATRVLVPTVVPTVAAVYSDEQTNAVQAPAITAPVVSAGVVSVNPTTEDTTNHSEPERDDRSVMPVSTATTDRPQLPAVDRPAPETTPSARPTEETAAQTAPRPSNTHDENQEANRDPTSDQTMATTSRVHLDTASSAQSASVVEAAAAKDQRPDPEKPRDVVDAPQDAQAEPPHASTDQSESTPREHEARPAR